METIKTKRAFCLLNHSLTKKQTAELVQLYGVGAIEYPAKTLSEKWSQLPATRTLDVDVILSVIGWLSSAQRGDVLIVQGEVGATFAVVDYALKRGLVPVHAVTRRVAQEVRCGEQVQKQHIFEHVCFREYVYFSALHNLQKTHACCTLSIA